jgi:hypothetical protein
MTSVISVKGKQQTYDVIVYQDATTTYAVSKAGVVLSSGLIAAHTDDVQIQAAITALASGGTIYIAKGAYALATKTTFTASISVKCDPMAIFTAYADVDLFQLGDRNRWDGGQFVVGSPAYASNVFTVEAWDYSATGASLYSFQQYIKNVEIRQVRNTTFAGKGLYLHCDNVEAPSKAIVNYQFESIHISNGAGNSGGFEYGIHVYLHNNDTVYGWINANNFRDCFVGCTKYGYYTQCVDGTGDATFENNTFTNCQFQAIAGTEYAWYIDGRQFLIETSIYDAAINNVFTFTAKALRSIAYTRGIYGSSAYYQDLGYENRLFINGIADAGHVEAWGTAANVNDGDAIDITAVGLSATPNWACVTGSVANEIVAITTLSDAHIVVAIKKRSDGSAGTQQTIYWRARI